MMRRFTLASPRFLASTFLASLMMFSSLVAIAPQSAAALSGSQFKAGRIIDDAVFYNSKTMTPDQIQAFLVSKVPDCDTWGEIGDRAARGTAAGYPPPYTCLKNYRKNTSNIAADSKCNGYTGADNETAANIIYKVARTCGINPRTLMVMLQKEQSLITDDWPWSKQYQKAMGAFCPDTAPCDPGYAGFQKQVYYGAHRLKTYAANPDDYNYAAGRNNRIYYHPDLSRCGNSTVYIQNQATASLYIYTPYRPNAAALANLYGEGDSCSSYGNRNFWRLFNDWFGSTTTSTLFQINGTGTYYLEWGDYYYAVPNGDILDAYGLTNIAPRSVSNFPSSKTRGPNLQRAVKFGSDDPEADDFTAQVEVVDGGKRHAAPNWGVLGDHGIESYQNYDQTLSFLLGIGDSLRSVVRQPNGAVGLLDDNEIRGFPDSESYSGLSGPNYNGVVKPYSEQSFTNMSSEYLSSKTEGAPMLLDGKIFSVSGSPAIFLFDNGQKHSFSASSYSAWGNKSDYSFSQTAAGQIPTGSAAPQLIKDGSSNEFALAKGKKLPVSAGVATEWGLTGSSFTTVTNRALNRLATGANLGRLVTGGGPGVYYIDDGQRHGVPTLSDFNRLGFSWNNVIELSGGLLKTLPRGADLYAPGSLVRTPNGAVSLIDDNYTAHGVTSGFMFTAFGFAWKNVINVTSVGLTGYTTDSLTQLVKDQSTNKYYVVDRGSRHYLDATAMGASVYNFDSGDATNLDAKAIATIASGSTMSRFLRGTNGKIYYIQNGQRRTISSEAKLKSLGGSWNSVMTVSDTFLHTIPSGTVI